ncbi:cold-responsive protein kinase 1-like isoform X2 [Phragmites australis]|uniref:cold-responsive protein kinase 1-like isoform X2 n=1 Tax=Phragmites australis TaxID=29695 RepID=UPI002D792F6A|nr:cold-responsive protein kinase 1-like isoform X2 [Phragmites australis]
MHLGKKASRGERAERGARGRKEGRAVGGRRGRGERRRRGGRGSHLPNRIPSTNRTYSLASEPVATNISSAYLKIRILEEERLQTIAMACFPVFRRKKNSRSKIVQHDQDIPITGNVKIYSSKELRKATRNFCPRNKLGQGSFGCVYLGKKNGEKVAIKVLSSESRQGTKEFLNELSVISNISHHNLVKLQGCCVDGGQKMLVYNYLENNSLAQTLFGNSRSGISFDWRTRVKICIGVADGLAYLHEEVRPLIVHRDIKASNILLDRDLNPKIADFGLAKLFPGNMTHISTRVAGTLGYLAPEYAIRGQLTKKADVYSFGVLLLEIVSGRCHTDPRLPLEDQYLLEKVWTLYESRDLESIIDRTLKRDFDTEEAHRLLSIGLLCTQDTPKIRPSMSMAAKMLKGEYAVSDRIMRPGLITDVMDLKIRTVEPVQLILSPSMSPAERTSLVSTLGLAGSTVLEESP